jgi:glycosyltransferase involved in cell wall biosynthesis
MKIAVVDNLTSGHRETYYKVFTRTFANMGNQVLLIAPRCPEADTTAFLKINSRPLQHLPVGQPIKKKLVVIQNALIRLQNLSAIRKQLSSFHPDIVFFPCLDDILPTIAPLWLFNRLMPYRWSGLLVQSGLPAYKSLMPDVRPFLSSKSCMGIGVLNEFSIDALKPFQSDIFCIPDFADLSTPDESYQLLATLKEKAAGRKIISLLGSIGTRKGIDLLLNTIPLLSENDYFFFLAGTSWLTEEQTEKVKTFAATHRNCLFSLERIPDEACFNALVSESDILFAVYRNFTGSSNLITKAAAFGKPIIVAQGECMGKRINEYGIGKSIPENDPQSCKDAIIELCNNGVSNPQGFKQYADKHSLKMLTDTLQKTINESQS